MLETDITTTEVWKPVTIAPFGENYSVSSFGRVRRDTAGSHTHPGNILRQAIQRRHGYPYVTLFDYGKRHTFRVHKLVAFTFLGSPPGPTGRHATNYQVDHINGEKTDNRPENLQWVFPKENMQLASQRGHIATGNRHWSRLHPERVPRGEQSGAYLHPEAMPRGEHHGKAIFTNDEIRQIRSLAANGVLHRLIAQQFHTGRSVISGIVAYRTWQHIDPEKASAYRKLTPQKIAALHPESRPRGEEHGKSKLTTWAVQTIRTMAAQGIQHTVIAKEFGITNANVGYIVARKTWRHVD